MADLATVATRRTCATLRGAFSRLDAASVSISLPSGGHAVAWFVGQSAVMIVLAFLLGLLVGWLVWYRRSEQVFDVASGRARPGTKTDMTIELPPVGPGASDETTELPPVEDAPDLMDSLGATDEPVTSKKADSKKAGAKKASATEPAATPAVAAEIPHPRTAEAPIDNTPTDEITTAAAAQLASAVSPAAAANPKPSRAKAKRSRAAKPAAEPVAVVPTPMVDEPELAPIDDLARIEGIGPKIAGALVDGGIRSFDQMAEADVDTLREAINAAGITFAPSVTTWSRQAALLAKGDEDGFQALVDHLIAGREPGTTDLAGPTADLAGATADLAGPTADLAEPTAGLAGPTTDLAGPTADLTPIDDLARIEGIGPKIAAALIGSGVRSYRQLADADVDTLREAINAAGISFAPSITTWSQQAKLLADGNEEEFQALTDRLVAGRAATDPADQPGPANDLARIEGIGPKVAAALVDAGIRTYRQLADADQQAVRAAINAAGITFAPSITTWSQQAQLLADGDEEGFTDLTLRLVAGRDNSGAGTPSDDAPTLPIASTTTAPAGAAAGATASAPAGAAAGGVASAVAGDKEHV